MRNLVLTLAAALGLLTTLALPAQALATTSPPTVGSFSPAKGPVGTLVKIHGTNFNAPGIQVTFGGTTAAPEYVTAAIILVRVPALAPSGIIIVKTRYGSAPSHTRFVVTKGLASFPRGAWPGQQITIAGSGLSPNRDFTLRLDGQPFGGVASNANGEFSTIRTLPGDLTVGPSHVLVAIDSITHVQQQKIHIWIFGSWPMARSDPEQTGDGAQ